MTENNNVTETETVVETAKTEFDMALESFLAACREVSGGNISTNLEKAKRYVRILKDESVFCFVERETGDVLKAASFLIPAKHARGNIYTRQYGINENGAVHRPKGRKPTKEKLVRFDVEVGQDLTVDEPIQQAC